MIFSYDRNYGADADGNRGITIKQFEEFDSFDYDDMAEQILEKFEPERQFYTVFLEDEDGDEWEFEVDVNEILTKDEIKNLEIKIEDLEDEIISK